MTEKLRKIQNTIKKKLPRGAIKKIAKRIDKDPSLISRILNGTRTDHYGVFEIAEQIFKEEINKERTKRETLREIAKSLNKFSS